MCQDRCQTTCQNWCSNTGHMFVIIFVRWFSLFFRRTKFIVLGCILIELISSPWSSMISIGEHSQSALENAPLPPPHRYPYPPCRSGPPGKGLHKQPRWENGTDPAFETLHHQENYCESGKLSQDINVIDLIPIWTILVTHLGGHLIVRFRCGTRKCKWVGNEPSCWLASILKPQGRKNPWKPSDTKRVVTVAESRSRTVSQSHELCNACAIAKISTDGPQEGVTGCITGVTFSSGARLPKHHCLRAHSKHIQILRVWQEHRELIWPPAWAHDPPDVPEELPSRQWFQRGRPTLCTWGWLFFQARKRVSYPCRSHAGRVWCAGDPFGGRCRCRERDLSGPQCDGLCPGRRRLRFQPHGCETPTAVVEKVNWWHWPWPWLAMTGHHWPSLAISLPWHCPSEDWVSLLERLWAGEER